MIRRVPLRRRAPLQSRPVSAAARRARAEAIDRAYGWCAVVDPARCTGIAVHAHHLLRRSQGGRDVPGNLLAVCAACHHYIHAHPAESYGAGWMIRSGAT